MNQLATDLLLGVIRPTLAQLGMPSTVSEQLLLGTALAESGGETRRQVSGPALGLWQMEPSTHEDCWVSWLRFRPSLAERVLAVAGQGTLLVPPPAELLVESDPYACAMARVRYLRVGAALPLEGDLAGLAEYWKRWYNTPGGAGEPARWVECWERAGCGK